MIGNLILATAITILSGTVVLLLDSSHGPMAGAGLLLSIAAGVYWLKRSGQQPFIPIAAIFCVVMPAALLYVGFLIAWQRGTVEL